MKRGRSPSPDNEAKVVKLTVLRPERKKPKLIASGKRPAPSARKQRLLQLLRRQKQLTGAVVPSGVPTMNSGLFTGSEAVSQQISVVAEVEESEFSEHPLEHPIVDPPELISQVVPLEDPMACLSKTASGFSKFPATSLSLISAIPSTLSVVPILSPDNHSSSAALTTVGFNAGLSTTLDPRNTSLHEDADEQMIRSEGAHFYANVSVPSISEPSVIFSDHPWSNKIHSPAISLPSPVQDTDLPLPPKQLDNAIMSPRYQNASEAVISGGPSQSAAVDDIYMTFDSATMQAPSNASSSLTSITRPDHIAVTFEGVTQINGSADEISGTHILPSRPLESSVPMLTADQTFLPTTAASQVQRMPEVQRAVPGDQPQRQTEIQGQSTNIPQSTDVRQSVMPQPQDPHPMNILRPANVRRGTDLPKAMDVDIPSDMDGNSSDLEEPMSDSDDNPFPLSSVRILKSATYCHLKRQPHDHCRNDTLAKIVEMLAGAKTPSPRLPKRLRERGQPRQYDVPRENNELKTCVREYAHHLLGQMPWDVPSREELLAFENGRGTGPAVWSFRLDLASPGLATEWNARAAEVFVDAFLSEDELAREFSDRKEILSAFIVHLTTLQKRYREPILRARMTEAELNGERDKRKKITREQRKRGLFRRRINATKDYEVDSLLKTLITSFWRYCTPEVMSDDETDSDWDGPDNEAPHFIKIMSWRNPDIVNFFRVLDALYFSTRFKGDKWSPGRFPHMRVPSVRLNKCDAVPGLPANFYRPEWLSQLSDVERRKLKTRPAISLDFSQNILRIAARFLHIRHRQQLPLPRDHPALKAITTSTFPSGFPLENVVENQHHQPSNEAPQPAVPTSITVPDTVEQMCTTFQPDHESLPLSGRDTPRILVPAPPVPPMELPPTVSHTPLPYPRSVPSPSPNSSNTSSGPNNVLLRPESQVPLVGLPGKFSSRPLINQPLEGPSRFPGSYTVVPPAGSGSTQPQDILCLPICPGQEALQSSSVTPPSNTGLSARITDQKQIEPFTLRKHMRRFTKKSVKQRGKAT